MNQSNETNNEEIKELLRDIQSQLQFHPRQSDGNEFLVSSLVSAQQLQINELKTLVTEKTNTTDENEGKLRAQELFWQSKVKNIEENVQDAIQSSEQKLQKIQEEFENEVSKLKSQRRKDKRKANKEKHTINTINNDQVHALMKENIISQIEKDVEFKEDPVETGVQAETSQLSKYVQKDLSFDKEFKL